MIQKLFCRLSLLDFLVIFHFSLLIRQSASISLIFDLSRSFWPDKLPSDITSTTNFRNPTLISKSIFAPNLFLLNDWKNDNRILYHFLICSFRVVFVVTITFCPAIYRKYFLFCWYYGAAMPLEKSWSWRKEKSYFFMLGKCILLNEVITGLTTRWVLHKPLLFD